ncbi:MAG: outer membrane lipoprotein-sorting protein [Ectothiorhodospiraceae bacterium]|nr:outer membrane lipoprotein-sorting protein [Ectothiorhodospiraceae bacterium]
MYSIIRTCIALLFISASLHAESPEQIVQKSVDKLRGESSKANLTMKIEKKRWSREVTMKFWAIEPDYALIYIIEPARDKGTVTLKRKNEVWNWLPSARRVIKIPPSMMMQSWMGSHFTNDDLVRESSIVDDYKHTMLGKEKVDGKTCYKIELQPKPDVGVVWDKLILWIDTKHYMQLKVEYYDEEGDLVRTMYGKEPKKMDGRVIPTRFELVPADEPEEKTMLIYNEIDFNVNLEKSFFSQQNMKRIR